MKEYPSLSPDSAEDQKTFMRFAIKERKNDVNDFTNLKNVFMSGRKVGKIPTGAADVTDGDRVGDFNCNASFLYILIDNAGTAEWRRATLSTF